MKGLLALILSMLLAQGMFAQGAALDRNFGIGGKVAINPLPFQDEQAASVVCQSDGKIVVAGTSGITSQTHSTTMIRYHADGRVDMSFGTAGQVMLKPGTGNSPFAGVAIQKRSGTERLILAGNAYDASTNSFSITVGRYLANGAPDGSFGTGGQINLPGGYAQGIAIDTAGNILIAGEKDVMNDMPQMGVLRLLPDGDVDAAFGTGGYATRPDTLIQNSATLKLQADGKIIVGGHLFDLPITGKTEMALVRYLHDGSIDTGFGIGGLVTIDPDTTSAEVQGIALQPDGKLLVCGISDTGTGNHAYLTRLLSTGAVDLTFGTGGSTRTVFGNNESWANEVLLHPDGRIYVVGYAAPAGAHQSYSFAIARYKGDGSIDSSFGVAGRDTSNAGNFSGAEAAVITPRNSIIAVGWSYWSLPLGRFHDITLMQYLTGAELGILNFAKGSEAVVYPNPVSTAINISYELAAADRLSISLLDMTGRSVQLFRVAQHAAAGRHREELSLHPSVSNGQYLLQIRGADGAHAIRLQVIR